MNEVTPLPEYTPEQLAAIYAEQKKLFTVEDLMQYLDNDLPRAPAEEVLAELERDADRRKDARSGAGAQKGAG